MRKKLQKLLSSALFLLLFAVVTMAQAPNSFNYQAVVRDASGNVLQNQNIALRIAILQNSPTGTEIYAERHTKQTNEFGLVNLEIGTGTVLTGVFASISWGTITPYLKIGIDLAGGTNYADFGSTKIASVPYAGLAGQVSYLQLDPVKQSVSLQAIASAADEDPIFEIKNKDGIVMLGVYNEGVRINVLEEESKGSKSGFAVGSFSRETKSDPTEIMRLTSDSIRFYIPDHPDGKSSKSGFAVGSFSRETKGAYFDLFDISPQWARIYIDDSGAKSSKSGFAVGSFSRETKADSAEYFNVSGSGIADIILDEPRIVWYPKKEAFLAGRVLIQSPDSVGFNATATGYQSMAKGNYSQAFGYQAKARGNFSTAIGNGAIANKINSFAFGENALAKNEESYAFGRGAVAEGFRSFAFGSAGVDSAGTTTGVAYAKGDYSFALGQGSQALGKGSFSIGIADTARGDFSIAFGYKARANEIGAISIGSNTSANHGYSTAIGWYSSATASPSIAIGINSLASGEYSTSIGFRTQAIGYGSFALGESTIASGASSTAFGYSTIASGVNSTAFGYFSQSDGWYSTAFGARTVASGYAGVAMGSETIALGDHSLAMGLKTNAEGFVSTAMGWNTTASGSYSIAMGANTIASGESSIAMGRSVKAIGNYAFAINLRPDTGPDVGDYTFRISGASSIGGNLAWTNHSDSRLKKDIRTLDGENNLEKILRLKGVRFRWAECNPDVKDRFYLGFLAQDVLSILPETVFHDELNDIYSLEYTAIIPLLVEGIKEQQQIIENLEQKLEDLTNKQNEIDQLKADMEWLKAMMQAKQ